MIRRREGWPGIILKGFTSERVKGKPGKVKRGAKWGPIQPENFQVRPIKEHRNQEKYWKTDGKLRERKRKKPQSRSENKGKHLTQISKNGVIH